MKNKEFFASIELIEKEKGISQDRLIKAIEQALSTAYRKYSGEASNVEIKAVAEQSKITYYAYKTVVEEVIDPDKEISLEEARLIKKSSKVGDRHYTEIKPFDFSRISAQTAKHIILQAIRDAEKELVLSQYIDKEGQMLVGRVCRKKDDGTIYVAIGKDGQTEGTLNVGDQNPLEKFNIGDTIKVFVKKVRESFGGVQILLTRNSVGFIKALFEIEVPEIKAGIVSIKGVAREAGYRTKIAVYSEDKSIDAVGACVGQHGVRVNAIIREIFNEKIDVIPWSEDMIEFISRTLSPAQVSWVSLNEESMEAVVIVPDDKLSLAIGKDGLNARLAVKLTGCKIDVKKYSDAISKGIISEGYRQEGIDENNEFDDGQFEDGEFEDEELFSQEFESESTQEDNNDEVEIIDNPIDGEKE